MPNIIKKISDEFMKYIFAISFSCISLLISVIRINIVESLLILAVSYFSSFYIWNKTINIVKNKIKENSFKICIPIFILSVMWGNFFTIDEILALVAIPAFLYLGLLIFYYIKDFLIQIYNRMEKWDKIAYIISSILGLIVITILYSTSKLWYSQNDLFFSIDSGLVYDIYKFYNYYSVQHPLFGFLGHPVYVFIKTVISVLVRSNAKIITAIAFQYFCFQVLNLIAIELKQLTKNRYVYVIYMISFPTLLFTCFLEKYGICVLCLITYIYQLCMNDQKQGKVLLTCAIGTMPTSIAMGLIELFTNNTIKEKIIKILKEVVVFIAIVICTGRLVFFKLGPNEIKNLRGQFGENNFSTINKFYATTHVIQNSMFALPASFNKENNVYEWDNTLNYASIGGIAILEICIAGFMANRKKLQAKAFTIWLCFAFVLFMILNWSVDVAPLFTIYFSWAVIALFTMGIDFICKELKINKHITYVILIMSILAINLNAFIDIGKVLYTI